MTNSDDIAAAMTRIGHHLPENEVSDWPALPFEDDQTIFLAVFGPAGNAVYFEQGGRVVCIKQEHGETAVTFFKDGQEVQPPVIGAN
jgi:hypothetical protein